MAAPLGNKNAVKGKPWRDAIARALEKDKKALDRVARSLIAKAEEGDIPAIKELGDRLDGRAVQQVDLGPVGEAVGRFVIEYAGGPSKQVEGGDNGG